MILYIYTHLTFTYIIFRLQKCNVYHGMKVLQVRYYSALSIIITTYAYFFPDAKMVLVTGLTVAVQQVVLLWLVMLHAPVIFSQILLSLW